MFDVKVLSTWLTILGMPSVFGLIAILARFVRKTVQDTKTLKEAVQSMIRTDLIKRYKEFKRDGCTELERKIWLIDEDRYAALGENGVLNHMREDVVSWDCLED